MRADRRHAGGKGGKVLRQFLPPDWTKDAWWHITMSVLFVLFLAMRSPRYDFGGLRSFHGWPAGYEPRTGKTVIEGTPVPML